MKTETVGIIRTQVLDFFTFHRIVKKSSSRFAEFDISEKLNLSKTKLVAKRFASMTHDLLLTGIHGPRRRTCVGAMPAPIHMRRDSFR